MLSPKKSPRAVFYRQMKLKIANGDIGEAQRDPCDYILMNDHTNSLNARHFGTKTNRHPGNSASQLDKSALVFFSLISLPLIVIVCILPVFFFS
jgi:hypothetical protein